MLEGLCFWGIFLIYRPRELLTLDSYMSCKSSSPVVKVIPIPCRQTSHIFVTYACSQKKTFFPFFVYMVTIFTSFHRSSFLQLSPSSFTHVRICQCDIISFLLIYVTSYVFLLFLYFSFSLNVLRHHLHNLS